METERSLTGLRDSLTGKVRVYLKDHKTAAEFLADAKAEGWSFGELGLPDDIRDNVVALKENRQLCCLGHIGRIEFQCNGGDNPEGGYHRIDYAKYKNGDKDYVFVP